ALLGSRDRAAILHAFLNSVSGVTTGSRARGSRDLLAIAVADLVTDDTTDHCADHRARHLLLVAHRRLLGHGFVVTFLARGLDRFVDGFDINDLRVVGPMSEHAIARDGAAGRGHCRTDDEPGHQRLVHACPPVWSCLPELTLED